MFDSATPPRTLFIANRHAKTSGSLAEFFRPKETKKQDRHSNNVSSADFQNSANSQYALG